MNKFFYIIKNIKYKKVFFEGFALFATVIGIIISVNVNIFHFNIWINILIYLAIYSLFFLLYLLLDIILRLNKKNIKIRTNKPCNINISKGNYLDKWTNAKPNDLFVISMDKDYTMNFNIKEKVHKNTIHGKFIIWCEKNNYLEIVEKQLKDKSKTYHKIELDVNKDNKYFKIYFILFPLTVIEEKYDYIARISEKDNKYELLEFNKKIANLIIDIQGKISDNQLFLPFIGSGNARLLETKAISNNKNELLLILINLIKTYTITKINIEIIIWEKEWESFDWKFIERRW